MAGGFTGTPEAVVTSSGQGTTRTVIKARAKAIFDEGIAGVIPDTSADGGWNDIINGAMQIVAVDAMCIKGKITIPTLKDAVASIAVGGTLIANGSPTIAITGTAGTGAHAVASISAAGDVSSVRVTEGGSGYTAVVVTAQGTRTFTGTLGVRSKYALTEGTDFAMLLIEEVTYNGLTIDPLAEDDLTSSNWRWREQAGGTPRNYYIDGIAPSAKIVLYPKPSTIGSAIEIFGRVRPAPMSLDTGNDTEKFDITSPFDWLVVWKAVQLACGQAMSDPLAAITKMQYAERQYLMNLDKYKGMNAWPDGRSLVKASAPGGGGWPPAYGRTEFM